jgi:alpha-methylacyl-CoA racemase
MDGRHWPALQERFTAIFRTRSRDEWCALMEGSDVCFAPVLGFDEVRHHAHARARGTYLEDGDVWQPAPAPRFSRSRPARPATPATAGADTDDVLAELGYDAATRARLREAGSIG